jgi:hypothetical protein
MTGQLTVRYGLSPALPDDRLYQIDRLSTGLVVIRWREGFIAEEALRDINEYSRHLLAGGIFQADPDPGGGVVRYTGGTQRYAECGCTSKGGRYEIGMDRVCSNRLGPLHPVGLNITDSELTFVVADTMVRPEVVKEYNEFQQGIPYRKEVWPKPEMDLASLLLSRAG